MGVAEMRAALRSAVRGLRSPVVLLWGTLALGIGHEGGNSGAANGADWDAKVGALPSATADSVTGGYVLNAGRSSNKEALPATVLVSPHGPCDIYDGAGTPC